MAGLNKVARNHLGHIYYGGNKNVLVDSHLVTGVLVVAEGVKCAVGSQSPCLTSTNSLFNTINLR